MLFATGIYKNKSSKQTRLFNRETLLLLLDKKYVAFELILLRKGANCKYDFYELTTRTQWPSPFLNKSSKFEI